MKEFTLIAGAALGALAVVFGAFGAHALKKTFTEELLKSFETGVKYQMYHALLLLFIGANLQFDSGLEQSLAWCILVGTCLFSFSIFGLCLSASTGSKWKFLGPVTPLGGLLLVIGWVMLLTVFIQQS